MISLAQAAQELGISVRSLRRLIAAKRIHAIRILERRIVIDPAELARYLAEGGWREPGAPPKLPSPPAANAGEGYEPWRADPWLEECMAPLDWYRANRKCFEIPIAQIAASTRIYSREADYNVRLSGVYFLFKDSHLLYVGKSVNIHSRLRQHHGGIIPFDRFTFVEVPNLLAPDAEMYYIRTHRPPYNSHGVQ